MVKKAFFGFLFIGVISMIIMSFHYFQSSSSGILKQKEIADSVYYVFIFRLHIFLGIVAMLVGPFQFIPKVRVSLPRLHRRIGYIYALSIFFSSLAGLFVAQFAMGGWITRIGFSILALLWLGTTLLAISSVRAGRVEDHEKWMYLSFALTFSAITQRTLLLIPLLTAIPFMPIYQTSAWLPWMINLSIAYFLFKTSKSRK